MSSDTSADLWKNYHRHFARFNTQDPTLTFPSHDLNLASHLPVDKNASILDFGCGMGHLMIYLKARGFTNVEGIDISASQVDYCRSIGLSNIEHVIDAIQFLVKRPNFYEVITAFDVFEHLPKPTIFPTLRAIYASLKVNGVLIIRVPNIAAAVGPWVRHMDFTHETLYTERSVYQILEMANFVDIEIRPNITHYNRKLLGRVFELARRMLYRIQKFIYFLQMPGALTPSIFTVDLMCIGKKGHDVEQGES